METATQFWTLMHSYEICASTEQYWTAMDIYIDRSHIVNRRLIGCQVLGRTAIQDDHQLQNINNLLLNYRQNYNKDIQELIEQEGSIFAEDQGQQIGVAIVKQLLPKLNASNPSVEIVLKDYAKNHVSFFSGEENGNAVPHFPYAFSFDGSHLHLWLGEGAQPSDPSCHWIQSKLLPKLVKWMTNVVDKSVDNINASLRLVSVTEYSELYTELKKTYGKQLVEMWPENTDPLKFVYEDIGIATYLLLLWKGRSKQRFVDLGCGNGLLVHILNSEGHQGVGYDLRARKIWSLYPSTTKLEVRTIIPSSDTVFPETDWLIGNHSDELTLWIPVMAARSSYSCNFFLLPCCPYEFTGKKYCRANTSVSQYVDFLGYVESVCGQCGFIAGKDKLRIPSTKRICFVGDKRTYSEMQYKDSLDKLKLFVEEKCGLQCGETAEVWCPQFKPRVEEKVRNCTQISSDIRESIVNLVAEQLLAKRRTLTEGWDYGGVVEISSLAKIVPADTLKQLKKECGGLQTLLKNHHYIFKVQSGKVQFRVPAEKLKSESSVWKKKPCWFYQNHPKSCPLSDEKCSYVHESVT